MTKWFVFENYLILDEDVRRKAYYIAFKKNELLKKEMSLMSWKVFDVCRLEDE